MFEQGLAMLVQANASVAALCPAGGYLAQLPPNALLPSWSYIIVSIGQGYTLQGIERHRMRRLQLDAYGNSADQAVLLAQAIDNVLSGYQGTLPDPDSTYVQGIFLADVDDFFDDTATSYRRMLEYEVHFQA